MGDANLKRAFEFAKKEFAQKRPQFSHGPHIPRNVPMAQQEPQIVAAEGASVMDVCGVCWNRPKTIVLAPCGHKGLCEACLPEIRAGQRCPFCRANIESYVDARRIFDV